MILKLYQVKSGGSLSPQECQKINDALATLKIEEIPLDQRENVADYLTSTINHNAVSQNLISALGELLQELQKNA